MTEKTDRFAHLREFLDRLTTSPGVYRMIGGHGQILYIGKAKNLRNRVRSYFQPGAAHSDRIAKMVLRVASIEITVTGSEMEALVLEDNLVKAEQPPYNVLLKDDKNYPYLKLTAETYPRLLLVRKVEEDGGAYFGPYVSARSVRSTMRLIHRLFPLRQSADNLDGVPPRRPCLNFQMRRCLGPCGGRTTPEEYAEVVGQVKLFLSGKDDTLVTTIEQEMWGAAKEEKFERAARLRDQLEGVRTLFERQSVSQLTLRDEDVIASHEEGGRSVIVIFQVRRGKVRGERSFTFDKLDRLDRAEALAAFIRQFYAGGMEIPPTVAVNEEPEGIEALTEALTARRRGKVRIVVPQRGDRRRLVELAERNARLRILDELGSKAGKAAALAEVARHLGLEEPPAAMEGYDISHTAGVGAVGVAVTFRDGLPDKKGYRTYKIRSATGGDDYGALMEVIERRFTRMAREGGEFPDLMIIDGGKGQVASVAQRFAELSIEPPAIVGIAKGEDRENPESDLFFVPGSSTPVGFPPSSAGRHLLQQVRDESHRFAIGSHRKGRDKQVTRSALDDVRGVGAKRKKALLNHFGSVKRIREASVEEVAAVLKTSVAAAKKIIEQI